MLRVSPVPEMVDRLRMNVERDWRFVTAGLEIVYTCAQIMARRREWEWDCPTISEVSELPWLPHDTLTLGA